MSNQEILNKFQDTIVNLDINGGVAAPKRYLMLESVLLVL